MATFRQQYVAKRIVESNGAVTVARAMREAGYSPKTVKNSQSVTKSKSWDQLMQKYLPDKTLAKVHKEGLQSTVTKPVLVGVDKNGKQIYDVVQEPDMVTREKYLSLAYKVKGKMTDKEGPGVGQMNIQINNYDAKLLETDSIGPEEGEVILDDVDNLST